MPIFYNTLEYRPTANPATPGVEKSLADWGKGLKSGRCAYLSQELDTFEISEAGAKIDASNLFDFVAAGPSFVGSTIVLRQRRVKDFTGTFSGGKIIFFGILVGAPRGATGKIESAQYQFNGPWWYLVNKTYKMPYKIFNGYTMPNDPTTPPTFITKYSGHLWLNRDLLRNWICTGEQIQAAVQYAIDQGAPIQLLPDVDTVINTGTPYQRTVSVSGSIKTFSDVPVDEVVDVTCAEIIKKQIRFNPDCVTWFDYNTTPFPTFYCQRRQFIGA